VRFPESGEGQLYALSDREAKTTLTEVYRKARAAHGNKRRTRNMDSDDFWIYPNDLEEFRDDRLLRIREALH
jgi:hypothetical protein